MEINKLKLILYLNIIKLGNLNGMETESSKFPDSYFIRRKISEAKNFKKFLKKINPYRFMSYNLDLKFKEDELFKLDIVRDIGESDKYFNKLKIQSLNKQEEKIKQNKEKLEYFLYNRKEWLENKKKELEEKNIFDNFGFGEILEEYNERILMEEEELQKNEIELEELKTNFKEREEERLERKTISPIEWEQKIISQERKRLETKINPYKKLLEERKNLDEIYKKLNEKDSEEQTKKLTKLMYLEDQNIKEANKYFNEIKIEFLKRDQKKIEEKKKKLEFLKDKKEELEGEENKLNFFKLEYILKEYNERILKEEEELEKDEIELEEFKKIFKKEEENRFLKEVKLMQYELLREEDVLREKINKYKELLEERKNLDIYYEKFNYINMENLKEKEEKLAKLEETGDIFQANIYFDQIKIEFLKTEEGKIEQNKKKLKILKKQQEELEILKNNLPWNIYGYSIELILKTDPDFNEGNFYWILEEEKKLKNDFYENLKNYNERILKEEEELKKNERELEELKKNFKKKEEDRFKKQIIQAEELQQKEILKEKINQYKTLLEERKDLDKYYEKFNEIKSKDLKEKLKIEKQKIEHNKEKLEMLKKKQEELQLLENTLKGNLSLDNSDFEKILKDYNERIIKEKEELKKNETELEELKKIFKKQLELKKDDMELRKLKEILEKKEINRLKKEEKTNFSKNSIEEKINKFNKKLNQNELESIYKNLEILKEEKIKINFRIKEHLHNI